MLKGEPETHFYPERVLLGNLGTQTPEKKFIIKSSLDPSGEFGKDPEKSSDVMHSNQIQKRPCDTFLHSSSDIITASLHIHRGDLFTTHEALAIPEAS